MAVVDIYTTLGDTRLGNTTPSDGIGMIVCSATATNEGEINNFALDTAYMITSVADLTAKGLTKSNNYSLVRHVEEYYAKAGSGSRVWVVGYAISEYETFIENKLEEIILGTTSSNFDLRPRMIAFGLPDVESQTGFQGTKEGAIPAKHKTLVADLQTLLNNLFGQSIRMVGIFDGVICVPTGKSILTMDFSSLENLANLDAPRVAYQIVTSTPGSNSSVGRTLGMLSQLSLATSPGAVSTAGPAADIDYFMDMPSVDTGESPANTPVSKLPPAKCNLLGQNQFLFTRVRPQMAGVYYNDGATCNDPEMALSEISFVRVGNAVCDSVERFFVKLLQENIPTDASTGAIDAGFKSGTLAQLDETELTPRINRGEAQAINVDFAAKDGNYNMSKAIQVTVEVLPLSPLREAYIETFFVTTLN
jgi:hypothetical protein